MEKDDTIEIGLNYKLFTSSIVLLSKFILEKINKQEDKNKTFIFIVDVCDKLINTYEGLPIEKDDGTIIKKVYTVLKNNIELLCNQDEKLFNKRNAKNKIITFIPGLDLRVIYKLLNDEDKQTVWNYIKLIFISVVKLIYSSNKTKCDENIVNICNDFEKDLIKKGININVMKFNPFVGVSANNNHLIDINQINSETDINNMFNMLNIDKLIDIEQLKDQLSKLSDTDIKSTTSNITSMLGNADEDVQEVCSTLVQNLVEDLKVNGMQNLFQTLKNVSEKVSTKVDVNKIKKTAGVMNGFVEKSEQHFKNLTDEHGNNPISAFKNNPELLLSFAQKCFNEQK